MSRKQPDLSINGLLMPLHVGAQATQEYEDFGGFTATPLRFADGAGLVQEAWRRVRTSIVASGVVPPGLYGIDWSAPVTLGCIAARSIQSASNVITIPVARRTDAAPYGFAITAAGLFKPTPVGLAGNVATLGAVAGAIGYQVLWHPLLTVLAPAGPRLSWDAQGAVSGWQLVAEEA